MDENDWILSCKKTFKLFLRRIYINNKTNRDKEQPRPLYEREETSTCERSERRLRHGYFINMALISIPFVCYFFLLPDVRMYSPRFYAFSEKPTQNPVKFTTGTAQESHIAKKEDQLLAKDRITVDKKKMNFSVTTERIEEYKPGLNKDIRFSSDILIIDEKTTSSSTLSPTTKLPSCFVRDNPKDTKVNLHLSVIDGSLNNTYPMVQKGGYFKPDHCISEHKVAILVPYRNRTETLNTFLYNLHPFLMAQNLEYRIFVIEQSGNKKFNKGRLFNAGFKELERFGKWRCVVLHDVDLLPLDRRISYRCPRFPRHMSSCVTNIGYYRNSSSVILVGGVTAMSLQHYQKINGHSNLYWGWGGEDIDLYWRIENTRSLMIARYNKTIGRYYHLPHNRAPENPLRHVLLSSALTRWEDDGLNSVEYEVISTTLRPLCTHILVNILPRAGGTVPHNSIVTSRPIVTAFRYQNIDLNSKIKKVMFTGSK